ncbi:tetratricopeptide repeat protein, partial [[Kitasatospora] papulosa]|uniref:tetratricopeptide repeat protein n=1 Tax=[Kitasatospora] papulosa TaxID=1464011 RepID=UPI0036958A5A
MSDEYDGHSPVVTELHKRLADGLARSRLTKTQLARRTGLGRTTVSQAFSLNSPAPSIQTVAELGRVLKLPVDELLELQRTAVEGPSAAEADGRGPGRPIDEWEPHALEIHPAGSAPEGVGSASPEQRVLPGYISRKHDRALAEAVQQAAQGRSRIVVLVGSSSTGKTRACWEAVQPLARKGWRLWHPFDPSRAEAALEELHRVRPHTVVWLNEAQHYLADPAVGERIAAAVHNLLVQPERGPVLVLGTLWPEYARQYTALPAPGGDDPHSQARELLAGNTLSVPEVFDSEALTAAAVLAESGDRLLADALSRTRDSGRVAQDLAGAPELLNRYEHATPTARALLEAAMDARRLGVGLHLLQLFLTDAASDYLSQSDYDQLTDGWAERAYAELAEPVHGKQAPLRRTTLRPPRRPPIPATAADPPTLLPVGPIFRLADYLEQHGRATRRLLCPPDSFWHAAYTHITQHNDLNKLAQAAQNRHRLRWAHYLRHRAAERGNTDALVSLAWSREEAEDWEGVEALTRQAADRGNLSALGRLALMREAAGDREDADRLLQQAADRGDPDALYRLATMRERAGDREGAEAVARQVADRGDTDTLYRLAMMWEEAGDREGAEAVARQVADRGDTDALHRLAELRREAGELEDAERLLQQVADRGATEALYYLAELREEAGDRKGAEAVARQAADRGNPDALY